MEVSVINSREKIMEALPLICKFYDDMERWLANPFMHYGLKMFIPKDVFNTLKNFIFHATLESKEHKGESIIFVTYATLAAHSLGLGSTVIGLMPPAMNKIDIQCPKRK